MTDTARSQVTGARLRPDTRARLQAIADERGVALSALVAELCDAYVAGTPLPPPAAAVPDGPPHRWTSMHRGNVCAVCAQPEATAASFCPGSRTRPK